MGKVDLMLTNQKKWKVCQVLDLILNVSIGQHWIHFCLQNAQTQLYHVYVLNQ